MYNLIVRPLRSRAIARVLALCEAVVKQHVPAPVQRLGSHTWERTLARWPALGALLTGALVPVPASPSSQRSAPAPRRVAQPAVAAELVSVSSAAAAEPLKRDAWLAELRDTSSPWEVRAQAATALADVQDASVLNALTAALRDPSAEVAASAATSIASQRDPAALATLRGALASRDGVLNPITRAAALAGLASRLAEDDFAPILDAVRDQDAEVSIAAIAAVAERAPAELVAHVAPVLNNDNGYYLPLVRLAAAHALARGAKLSADAANALCQRESDPMVRAALQAIANAAPAN